jgi:hypothetical protein
MHRSSSWDGWHGLARTGGGSPQLHMPYDSTDSLDYLVCLETLPWERCGWLPPRVVAEHVEWVLATPLNAMPPAWLQRTGPGAFSAYTY